MMTTVLTAVMLIVNPSRSMASTIAAVPLVSKVVELATELMLAACAGVICWTIMSTVYASVASSSKSRDHCSVPGVHFGVPLLFQILLILVVPPGAPTSLATYSDIFEFVVVDVLQRFVTTS